MQDSGSLAVFKVTARDQGHYKGPLGAFFTYCNISFCFFKYLFSNIFALSFFVFIFFSPVCMTFLYQRLLLTANLLMYLCLRHISDPFFLNYNVCSGFFFSFRFWQFRYPTVTYMCFHFFTVFFFPDS